MKWDFVSSTVWGLDQPSLSPEFPGQSRFNVSVVEMASRLNCDIETGKPKNGYSECYYLKNGDTLICQALTGGTGDAEGSSQFIAASTADRVYPIIRDLFPSHNVSRLDAAEDYCEEGAWGRLEAILTKIAKEHRVSMRPNGEGHKRPDGTRDKTKGRTWYFGGKSSVLQIVLYEKGLEMLSKGIPADPNWVRVEIRVHPSSKSKSLFAQIPDLSPAMLFGMSAWSKAVGEALNVMDLKRFNVGTVWKPSDLERTALYIATQFAAALDGILVQQGSPERAWMYLQELSKRGEQARNALKIVNCDMEVSP